MLQKHSFTGLGCEAGMEGIFLLSDILVHVGLQVVLVSEFVSISKVHFLSKVGMTYMYF